REAGAGGDFREGCVAVLTQELLRPFDSAGDDVLVGRKPGGRLELPRGVIGAGLGDRRYLVLGRAALEGLLDVLDDPPEPSPRQNTIAAPVVPPRRPDVTDQLDGQAVG